MPKKDAAPERVLGDGAAGDIDAPESEQKAEPKEEKE